MPERPPQNFENHVRHDRLLYGYVFLLLVALILALAGFVVGLEVVIVGLILNIVATALLALNARRYATTVQDRVIRLEMRLRLQEILPAELRPRIPEFTRSQLIALRFASDQELPELARKVLEQKITSPTDIKRMVTDWQADHLRV